MRARPIVGHCRRCGGAASYQRSPASGAAKGPWLHLYQADWQDDPHNVEPDDDALAALAAVQGAAQ